MDRSLIPSLPNSFLSGMLGGALSALLIGITFLWLMRGFSENQLEIVVANHHALNKMFARTLAKQDLTPVQGEQQMWLFWKRIQKEIKALHPGKTTIVLTREAALNTDLKDITEALWRAVEKDFSQKKNPDQKRRNQE